MIGIYKITNPIGKIYIGQSIDIHKRWRRYKNLNSVKCQPLLYNSFKFYGYENHTFDIICICTIEDLNFKERYYQEYFNVINEKIGLNSCYVNTENKNGIHRKRDNNLLQGNEIYHTLTNVIKEHGLKKLYSIGLKKSGVKALEIFNWALENQHLKTFDYVGEASIKFKIDERSVLRHLAKFRKK